MAGYLGRWRQLSRAARLYLLHAALLTSSLAITSLLFNLAILALGYPRGFLGLLGTLSLGAAAVLSLPLWWLVTRIGLRQALIISATLQAANTLVFALWPTATPLLIGSALTGAAAVLFQVSAPPFMMRHSNATVRDHLFSANAAINVSLAGVGSLIAGRLPELMGRLLRVGGESTVAYRATFGFASVVLALSLVPLLFISERGMAERGSGGPAEDPIDHRSMAARQHAARFRFHSARFAIYALLERVPTSWRGLIRRPGPLLRLLVAPLLISCGAALLVPYLNLFFKERFDVTGNLLGLIFAALGIVTGVTALGGPALSGRIGKIRTVVVTQALSIPFLLLLGFTPLLGVAIGAALGRAALFNMASPLYDAFAMERSDEAVRPLVIGLINGAYGAGYVIMPLVSTWTQDRFGFAPLFVATAICYALAVLANYWFFARADARRVDIDIQPSAA